jgi:hypothetical protein
MLVAVYSGDDNLLMRLTVVLVDCLDKLNPDCRRLTMFGKEHRMAVGEGIT